MPVPALTALGGSPAALLALRWALALFGGTWGGGRAAGPAECGSYLCFRPGSHGVQLAVSWQPEASPPASASVCACSEHGAPF